ncbi:hypothetical protein GN956_G480 [Arapaima gigas]
MKYQQSKSRDTSRARACAYALSVPSLGLSNMAASRGDASESSSSEDGEEMEKVREAAWSFVAANGSQSFHPAGGESKDKQSRRVDVSHHEHDGNELQTTPGFRAHVAKKLGVLLDSCISDAPGPELQKNQTTPSATRINEDEEHDGRRKYVEYRYLSTQNPGFRLFSTSIPGANQNSPPRPTRRPIPSSSDSDSELDERLKEAAVSITDLLPTSLLREAPQSSYFPTSITAEVKKLKKKKINGDEAGEKEDGGLSVKKQRNDTKEDNTRISICSGCTTPQDSGSPEDSTSLPISVERRKKKKVHRPKLSD